VATVLLVGCGDIGSRLGLQLSGVGYRCYGLKRHLNQLPEAIQGIQADVSDPASLAGLPVHDYLVYSLVPSQYSPEGYRQAYVEGLANLLQALRQQQLTPKRIFFISSTAVYHQQHGEWLDEGSPTQPRRFNGQTMLEAEALLAASGFAGTAVRFSGIYGPGRDRLLSWVRQGVGAALEPPHYGNRIHIEDCVGVLQFLIGKAEAGHQLADCYLASDPHPAAYAEVLDWLRLQLGLAEPSQRLDFGQKLHSGSKRCRPQRLLDAGYQFHYPDYQAGFKALLAAER
jgi:nucleoside-diphosphate-sugar epimerase